MKLTRAYMPGLRRNSAFVISISICAVRVAGIEDRRDVGDAARELLAGERVDLDVGPQALRDPPEVLFDDVRDEPHHADVDDRHERPSSA